MPAEPKHPRCPECAVPMWLIKFERHATGNPTLTLQHFECKACDATAVVPLPVSGTGDHAT
jgi:hypothetical protein